MKRLSLFLAIFAISCGTPEPFPKDSMTIELTWENDSDLDLEIWDAEKPLPRNDDVSGREFFAFGPGELHDTYRVAVSYFAAGPSRDTEAHAIIVIRQHGRVLAQSEAFLNDDLQDYWIPFEVSPKSGGIVQIGAMHFREF